MKRREFIGFIGYAAVNWPFAVCAQQPAKVPRIGSLFTRSLESPEARAMLDAFRQGLRISAVHSWPLDRAIVTPLYGPAVRRKKFRRSGLRSCINVSGL